MQTELKESRIADSPETVSPTSSLLASFIKEDTIEYNNLLGFSDEESLLSDEESSLSKNTLVLQTEIETESQSAIQEEIKAHEGNNKLSSQLIALYRLVEQGNLSNEETAEILELVYSDYKLSLTPTKPKTSRRKNIKVKLVTRRNIRKSSRTKVKTRAKEIIK